MAGKIWKLMRQLLFPLRCPVCDGIVTPFGEKICTKCIPLLPPLAPPFCLRCGKKLQSAGELCEACSSGHPLFVRGRALFDYAGAALPIYRFKYGGRREYADFFGEETERVLGDYLRQSGAEALIPIPIHKSRGKSRGYNQAAVYARAISRHTGIPVRENCLKRVRNTAPMKTLSPRERQNNLKKAFIVPGNEVKLNRVMLVDDIFTTGATMNEAAGILRAAGVKEIYFVTLAAGTGV
ncbi:MAG: ComF family protein [Lachnospiraceae bacterium]|nr:ComF family protein [Lachnospiraceae bacterium]